MKVFAVLAALAVAAPLTFAQGGSGAPSPVGQSETPQAASAADHAVEARHDTAEERSKARAAKRAAKKAAKSASASTQ